MHKSKLLDYLKTFEKSEWRELRKYLESGFVKIKDVKVLDLLEIIRKIQPDFESPRLAKEKVYKKLFPNERTFNAKRILSVMSILCLHIENFFLFKNLARNEELRGRALLDEFKERNLDKAFFSLLKAMDQEVKSSMVRDVNYYRFQLDKNIQINAHPSTLKEAPSESSLEYVLEYLDLYYVSAKLKYSTEVLNRQTIVNKEFSNRFLNDIVKWEGQAIFKEEVYCQIYFWVLKMMQEKDQINKGYYYHLKELVFQHISVFTSHELGDLIVYLVNYGTILCRQGHLELYQDQFEVYQLGIANKAFEENGIFENGAFQNIVTVACFLREYKWAAGFIDMYSVHLMGENRENTVLINKATIRFFQKRYVEVLELLIAGHFVLLYHKLMERRLRLQCYFELEGYENVFYDTVNSFSTFLRRNKVMSAANKEALLNFIWFAKKIFDAKNVYQYDTHLLREKLEQTKGIAYRRWILEKLEELEEY